MSEQHAPAMIPQEVAGYLSVGGKPVYTTAKRRGRPRFNAADQWWFEGPDFDTFISRQKQATRNHVEEEG